MAGGGRGRLILFSVVFFAALTLVGLVGVKSSNYRDVAQLQAFQETGPVRGLAVKGFTVNLKPGEYLLVVGETVFRMRVASEQPYAVAERIAGPRLGGDDSYAFFLLRGSNGFTVASLFSAKTFQSFYGPQPIMESEVVVSGTYNPQLKARLYLLTPDGGRVLVGEYPVFMVDKILEGCHSSYGSGVGRA